MIWAYVIFTCNSYIHINVIITSNLHVIVTCIVNLCGCQPVSCTF